MKVNWCTVHGSNVGLGLDHCYYAFGRSFDFGPCQWQEREILTAAELDTIERNAYARGVNWLVFDQGSEPISMEHSGEVGWWIPAVT